MSKFFIITGCLFIVLLIVFFTISYVSPFSSKLQKAVTNNKAQSVLYFKPNTIYSPCLNTATTTTIYVDSNNNPLTGAQIELAYNPLVINHVNITTAPDNFFGKDYTVLIEEVREEYGRATLAIEENPGRTAKKGTGAVATLSFQAVSNEASQTATISFLNKSTATNNSYEGSLLKEARPLEVICRR